MDSIFTIYCLQNRKIKTEMSGSQSDLDLYRVQVRNVTEITMFILMGFTDDFEVQVFLFLLFLAIYLFTLMGNLGLVFLVIVDSRLHNPMYHFLSVLSSLDACCSSVVTPKMIVNFLVENKTISYHQSIQLTKILKVIDSLSKDQNHCRW